MDAAHSPAIILSHPQMGENIGAAARAMFNFGLTDLRIVAPRDGWPNERADAMAAGALESMPPVRVFATLPEALADLHLVYATTARSREMVKPVYTPQGAIDEALNRSHESRAIGFLFGRERTGLENDEIALCHGIINIPANPSFSSLNLGQSVLLIAYEWMRQSADAPDRILHTGDSIPASGEQIHELTVRLMDELEAGHFFRSAPMRPTMERNIRNIFTRAELTDQETRTFHGIITALIGRKNKRDDTK